MTQQYLFTRDKAERYGLFGQLDGYAYNNHDQFPRANLAYMEADGEHKLSTCHTCDLFYYIIEGEGVFQVGGERFDVKATDAVLVPRETEYGYRGKMKYVLFLTPAFTEGCETRTDKSIS